MKTRIFYNVNNDVQINYYDPVLRETITRIFRVRASRYVYEWHSYSQCWLQVSDELRSVGRKLISHQNQLLQTIQREWKKYRRSLRRAQKYY